MDMLQKLMEKKRPDKDMDPKYKAAKMGVLDHISNMAGDAMGKGLDQLKTVMVGSNDRKGLEEGLDKAKNIVSKSNRPLDSDEMEPMTADNEHNSSDEHEKPKKYANGGMAKGDGMSDQAVADDDEQSEYDAQYGHSYASKDMKSPDDEQSEYTGQKRYAEGGFSKGMEPGMDNDNDEDDRPNTGDQDGDESPDSMDDTGDGGLSTEDIDQLIAELQSKKAKMKK